MHFGRGSWMSRHYYNVQRNWRCSMPMVWVKNPLMNGKNTSKLSANIVSLFHWMFKHIYSERYPYLLQVKGTDIYVNVLVSFLICPCCFSINISIWYIIFLFRAKHHLKDWYKYKLPDWLKNNVSPMSCNVTGYSANNHALL